jgi:putative chitinase
MITQTQKLSELDTNTLKIVQTALQKLGYYTDKLDGLFGKNTGEAFARWKTDNYLSDTDLIGQGSWVELEKQASKIVTVNWSDFTCKVSTYFTTGEVAQGLNNRGQYIQYRERIPTNKTHQQNAIRLAKELDKVREWWNDSLLVTSWYRPPAVERRVGGSGYSHPFGLAADIRPANGLVKLFQQRFEKEWYNTGKWNGGFGRGWRKGFIHCDLRNRRSWDY